jgi:hypothetical protein
MQNWYSCLVSEIGADFKFLSGIENSVSFSSKSISSLCIVAEERLEAVGGKGIIADYRNVWDLLIIDAGLAVDGVDWLNYSKTCAGLKRNVKNLVIFAPCPFPHERDISSAIAPLKEMVKHFLHESAHRDIVGNLKIDESILNFDRDTPAMRYYTAGKLGGRGPNVVTLEYKIDKTFFNANNRHIDIQTGMPFYVYGGNVFEEYEPELKTKYMRARYDMNDVEKLRGADGKLSVFLDKLDEVLKKPENNAVIYFTSKKTLKYISKIISAVYPDLAEKDGILTRTDSVLDSRFLKCRFSGESADNARVILATDLIGEHYYGIGRATHVFNYEYPTNPAELERRFFRTARTEASGIAVPQEFIVFSDKDLMFDGRILCKVMMGNLHKCFKKKIPSQNILFAVPEAEKYIVEVLTSLKFTIDNAKGAGLDHARDFCSEYNVEDRGLVSTAVKAGKYAEQILERLVRLLDLEKAMPAAGKPVDKLVMLSKVKESLDKISKGYIYYDDSMKPCIAKNTNKIEEIAKEYEQNVFAEGVRMAKEELDVLVRSTADGCYPQIRAAVSEMPEGLRTPALYNIWKYCKIHKGFKNSLKEFLEYYNKGEI